MHTVYQRVGTNIEKLINRRLTAAAETAQCVVNPMGLLGVVCGVSALGALGALGVYEVVFIVVRAFAGGRLLFKSASLKRLYCYVLNSCLRPDILVVGSNWRKNLSLYRPAIARRSGCAQLRLAWPCSRSTTPPGNLTAFAGCRTRTNSPRR